MSYQTTIPDRASTVENGLNSPSLIRRAEFKLLAAHAVRKFETAETESGQRRI